MGFTELLTIVFVVLKLIGTIDWAWWLVLLPEIIAGVFYLIIVIASIVTSASAFRAVNRVGNEIRKHSEKF